jgi:hypothetical protein
MTFSATEYLGYTALMEIAKAPSRKPAKGVLELEKVCKFRIADASGNQLLTAEVSLAKAETVIKAAIEKIFFSQP